MLVRRASLWTESVFHVLAHVEAPGLPSSCHDARYVAWIGERLGSIEARALGEDTAVIARVATTHDVLAGVQALAWVFDSPDQCRRASDRELGELGADDVASADALSIALSTGPIAEVVRAAAELELPLLAGLVGSAAARVDLRAVRRALDVVSAAAPSLRDSAVSLALPLGLRGRAFARSIVAGVPGIACPDVEHVAWQAAHEATVVDLNERERSRLADVPRGGRARRGLEAAPAAHLDGERRAIARLEARARLCGLGDAHARWLARLDLDALGAIRDVRDAPE